MRDWLNAIARAASDLSPDEARDLEERGFVVLPGPVGPEQMERLSGAYDAAVASATVDEVKTGSTTTRVSDFVNRGADFDVLYIFPPLLAASLRVIGRPFKLSSLHARTLRPRSAAQGLHVDVRRHSRDWPLVGFILMIDAFRPDNGATRFVPGSHLRLNGPENTGSDRQSDQDGHVLACGPAGSLVVFNGSAWHEHSANGSDTPRRSIQGAFIPRDGHSATDFAARMQAETRARLSPLARYVLAV